MKNIFFKFFLFFVLFLCYNSPCLSKEFYTPSLKSSFTDDNFTSYLNISHRFYRDESIDDITGANVGFDFGILLWNNFETYATYSYVTTEKERRFGAAYSFGFYDFRTLLNAEYFSFENEQTENRESSGYYLFGLEYTGYKNFFFLNANIGYDYFNNRTGFGFGSIIRLYNGSGILQGFSLIGEYYPRFFKDSGDDINLKSKNSYSYGINFSTYKHEFILLVSNSVDIGSRRMMLGTDSEDLFFGFNIRRTF